MTVLDVFRAAFGPLPDGNVVGCHFASNHGYGVVIQYPTVVIDSGTWSYLDGWERSSGDAHGPDIQDRCATCFIGMFPYDAIYDDVASGKLR